MVNWIIYKAPIAIFVPNNHFSIQIGNYASGQINDIPNSNILDSGHSYVSNVWGGKIISFLSPTNGFILNGKNISIDEIAKQNPNIVNSQNLFNSLSGDVKNKLLLLCNNDQNLASQYYWIINNGFTLDGHKYSIEILAHTSGGILNDQSAIVYESYWYSLSPKAIQLALYVAIKVFFNDYICNYFNYHYNINWTCLCTWRYFKSTKNFKISSCRSINDDCYCFKICSIIIIRISKNFKRSIV